MRRYTELAHELLGIPITPRQRELFVTEFIPMPPQGLVTDRVARNVEEARNALRLIFESKTTEQVAGTAYGLVQAAGEYLDHVRTARSWETRLNRTLIRPEPLKHRALSLIREVIARHKNDGLPRDHHIPGHPASAHQEQEGEHHHEPDQYLVDLPALRRRVHQHPARQRAVPDCVRHAECTCPHPEAPLYMCPDAQAACSQCGGPVCVRLRPAAHAACPCHRPHRMCEPAGEVTGDGG